MSSGDLWLLGKTFCFPGFGPSLLIPSDYGVSENREAISQCISLQSQVCVYVCMFPFPSPYNAEM